MLFISRMAILSLRDSKSEITGSLLEFPLKLRVVREFVVIGKSAVVEWLIGANSTGCVAITELDEWNVGVGKGVNKLGHGTAEVIASNNAAGEVGGFVASIFGADAQPLHISSVLEWEIDEGRKEDFVACQNVGCRTGQFSTAISVTAE
jgi:hypothetical protein